MKVVAGVVSWNTADRLPGALRSLAAQSHGDLDVLVIDNASVDGSAHVALGHGVEVIANPTNRGYAGAANQVVARAVATGAEAVLLANPDVVLDPGYVEGALAALAAAPRRAAVQGRLWRFDGVAPPCDLPTAARVIDTTGHLAFATRLFRNRGEGHPDGGRWDAAGPVFGVSGALAVYRTAALLDVAVAGEVFDEDLFAFWEDVDLDWRLALRGWEAWYAPDATAWHERGGAGPRRSAVVERLNFTNRLLVLLKDDDPAALARALPGVALTTGLKAVDLAVTVPSAFAASFGGVRLVPRMLAKRRVVQSSATVDPAAVVARWFDRFDYQAWVRTWWRRVRPG